MRYLVLSFLCLVTVIGYFHRSAFNVPSRVVEADLGMDSWRLGLVLGGWYLAYALFQLPAGAVADRLGAKRALLLFATAWSGLTALTGLSQEFFSLLLVWGLMGAAQAGLFPCCTKAIGAVFPRGQQAFASGMVLGCMGLGGALSAAVTGQLLGPLTWRQILFLAAVPGLAWAAAFALFTPSLTGPRPGPNAAENTAPPPPLSRAQWVRLVTDRQMLLLCVQQFCRAGPFVIFYSWFARVLMETWGLDKAAAGSLAAWPPLIAAAGGFCGGILSDWLLKRTGNARLARQGMTFAATAISTAAALGAYVAPGPQTAVAFMSVAAFCGMAAGVSGYSVAISYGGRRVATVFAAVNMAGNLGGSVFNNAVGGLTRYVTPDWNCLLLLFAAMFATSAACWAVLNPKGTLFDEPA